MKNLSKLAYILFKMGLEKEAGQIDDLIKLSSEQKICKKCGALNDCDNKECYNCGHDKFSECKETQENYAKDKPKKRDACYYKVKSRYKKWPSAYACVPIDNSKGLTRDGWKSYHQLKLGEEILTYNLESDSLEFSKILNLHSYNDAPVIKMQSGNTGFKVESTHNHKWVLRLPEVKTARKKYIESNNNMIFVETSDLLRMTKQSLNLVTSSNYINNNLNQKDIMYKYGTNWIKYLLDSSPEQIQAWLFSAIVYDGCQRKIERLTPKKAEQTELDYLYTSNVNNKQSFCLKQKDSMHRDAFLLSAFLNGGQVSWKNYKDISSCFYTSNKTTRNISNFKEIGSRISNVWCPETKNGTWVMMQEVEDSGVITITGNSGALVKCREVGAKNWGESSKKKKNKKKK